MSRVPDLLVERLRLNDLPPAQARSIRARLEQAGELHRLDASDEIPPISSALRAAINRTQRDQATLASTRNRTWTMAVIAASLAAVAFVATLDNQRLADPFALSSRTKGDHAALTIYRLTTTGPEALSDGANAHAGDVLQLSFSATHMAAIYSIDGRGDLTEHRAPAPAKPGDTRLQHAFELDDAPAFERFVLITGPHLDPALIHTTLARVAATRDPTTPIAIANATIHTFVLRKPSP